MSGEPRLGLRGRLAISIAALVIAAFLMSVGLGYASAMVQLHFQHASPGNPLPSADDVVRHFHGDPDPKARVRRLVRGASWTWS